MSVLRYLIYVLEFVFLLVVTPGSLQAAQTPKNAVFPDVFIVDYVKAYKKK